MCISPALPEKQFAWRCPSPLALKTFPPHFLHGSLSNFGFCLLFVRFLFVFQGWEANSDYVLE